MTAITWSGDRGESTPAAMLVMDILDSHGNGQAPGPVGAMGDENAGQG
ncbi:hypothetical protein [Nocardioides sp. CER19]|nr:hypothetical protein [Nocardioides sp. CER19]MDH2414505.1 hypothetical protein [Nocardioides sp. CER19]